MNLNDESLNVAIILPFLNEQQLLAHTCCSLGFGKGVYSRPQNSTLFLIDNGSTDESLCIARQIQRDSPSGSVILTSEPERGHVPARHRGVLLAQSDRNPNLAEKPLLVLQVDADTFYRPGYVDAMQRAAQNISPNVLLEARTEYPREFVERHSDYVELCQGVDTDCDRWFVPSARDVIVDDKVSAYRIADYFNWGGHQREFTLATDEIYAETSRLYMRAKFVNALRHPVDSALAEPSMRRLIEEPSLDFATAGFPRERSWRDSWLREYQGPKTLVEFCRNTSHLHVQRAIRMRKMHLLALFAFLPLHVSQCLKRDPTVSSDVAKISLPLLPHRSKKDLEHPGVLLTDVFTLIHNHGDYLLSELGIG